MEMQFKNEIKKLADIVVWADNWITELKDGLTEEEFEEDAEVKEFEAVKKAVLESMEKHSVYTNALNTDIVAKDAKIDLMQKELDGRKAGYVALKTQMDNVTKELEDTKEALDKTIESWVPLNAHDKVVDDLKDAIKERDNKIVELEKELADCKVKIRHQKENLDGINKTLEIRTKENESLIKVKNNQDKEIEAHESENARLSEKIIELKRTIEKCKDYDNSLIDSLRINNDDLKEQVEYLKKELEDTYWTKEADLKNHNKRDMTLVDELAKKNRDIEYHKDQERIRTEQLRATERKVDELWGLVNELKKEKKEGDDYAKSGFKLYVKNTLAEAEGNKNEANEIITEAVRSAYTEWNKTQIYKKKEKTKKELNEKFGAGGIVDEFKEDIPCGEDAIE